MRHHTNQYTLKLNVLAPMPLLPSLAILMIRKYISESQNRPSSIKTTHSSSRLHSVKLASNVNWLHVWETGRDKGPYWTRITQSFFKVLTYPLFGELCCPKCSTTISSETSYCEHLMEYHCPSCTLESLNKLLSELNSESELTF